MNYLQMIGDRALRRFKYDENNRPGHEDYGAEHRDASSIETADLVISKAVGEWHYPVLDIDYPAALVPSSTPGHFHLYLNRAVPWEKYQAVLDALADACLIESGYRNASKERGYTSVRLPWRPKKQETAA